MRILPYGDGRKLILMASESCSQRYEYRDMASRSKAAYSERKRQKSTFILTVNSPVYPPIQGKENRLFLRPFIAAKETGGLDFLIAHALLIVCHSLFEVVIEILSEAPLSAVRSRWRWNALSARTEA